MNFMVEIQWDTDWTDWTDFFFDFFNINKISRISPISVPLILNRHPILSQSIIQ